MVDTGLYIGPDNAPDRYRLLRSIGRGGEAVLYLAELELSGATEPVVVKVLDARQTLSQELFSKISGKWREQAELLRFVHRLGVVGIREHFEGPSAHPGGAAQDGGGRALYLVMNHVEGLDLRDWRAERTLQTPAERRDAVRALAQLADVLDWLHSGTATPSGRTVVHGDLSPGNVMIDANGQATLVDFGLSKLTADHQTAEVWFTPGFAAPEVFEGKRTPATDRYAFGAIAYFLLSGVSPATMPETLRAALLDLPELAVLDQDKAAKIAAIFANDPAKRPESLAGWVRELRPAVISTTTRPPVAKPPAAPAAPAAPPVPAGPPPPAHAPGAVPTTADPALPGPPAAAAVPPAPRTPPQTPSVPAHTPPPYVPPPAPAPEPVKQPVRDAAPEPVQRTPAARPPAVPEAAAAHQAAADQAPGHQAPSYQAPGHEVPGHPDAAREPAQRQPAPQPGSAAGSPSAPQAGARPGFRQPEPDPATGSRPTVVLGSAGMPSGGAGGSGKGGRGGGRGGEPKRRSRKPRVIAAAVIALVLVGGGAYAGVALSKDDKGSPSGSDAKRQTTGGGTSLSPSPSTTPPSATPPPTTQALADDPATVTTDPEATDTPTTDLSTMSPGQTEALTTETPADLGGTLEKANAEVSGQQYYDALVTSDCYGGYAEYNLGFHWSTFKAVIGVDDSKKDLPVEFTISADGQQLFHSQVTLGHPVRLSRNVSGKLRLHIQWAVNDTGEGCGTGVLADPTLVH